MSEAIELIPPEEAQRPFWDQYWRLKKALADTERVLRALGVSEFPDAPSPGEGGSEIRDVGTRTESEPSMTQSVRAACKALQRNITRESVATLLQRWYPNREFNRASIGTLLSSAMVDEKLVRKSESGSGGQPNRYELTAMALAAEEGFQGRFMHLVTERRQLIASWLEHATVIHIGPTTIWLAFPPGEDNAKASLSRDNQRKFLEGLAEEILERPMRIQMVLGPG